MPIMDSVSKVNALIRTLIALVVVGGISYASWLGYSNYNAREIADKKRLKELSDARKEIEQKDLLLKKNAREIVTLNKNVAEQKIQIDRLDTALRLIKVDHRVARLSVLDQKMDGDRLLTKLEFVEINDEGKTIDKPRTCTIVGDIVYVDAWVVKFEDTYVEKADLHRSTSLVQFRRIFGEHQQPNAGFPLYDPEDKGRPTAYGKGQLSEFEKQIWDDFWAFANNPEKAQKLGIKALHGEAPHIKVMKGKTYRVTLRASGGLTIKASDDAPPTKPAT